MSTMIQRYNLINTDVISNSQDIALPLTETSDNNLHTYALIRLNPQKYISEIEENMNDICARYIEEIEFDDINRIIGKISDHILNNLKYSKYFFHFINRYDNNIYFLMNNIIYKNLIDCPKYEKITIDTFEKTNVIEKFCTHIQCKLNDNILRNYISKKISEKQILTFDNCLTKFNDLFKYEAAYWPNAPCHIW